MFIGGVVCPIDYTCNAQAVAESLKFVNAKVILAHPDTVNAAIEAASIADIPSENVFVLGRENISTVRSIYNTFLDHDELATPVKYSADELENTTCYLVFTSGTTGKEKAVRMT